MEPQKKFKKKNTKFYACNVVKHGLRPKNFKPETLKIKLLTDQNDLAPIQNVQKVAVIKSINPIFENPKRQIARRPSQSA